jgi:hypothetical protein
MVAANTSAEHRFICLTDQPDEVAGVENIDIRAYGLTGWWAKMLLFHPLIRGHGRVVYLDLDTVIVNSLDRLTRWNGDFGICENFTKLAGHATWPCAYGSCVMSFADDWGAFVLEKFLDDKERYMSLAGKYGDQLVIEKLVPWAELLQNKLPRGFFLNKRDLHKYPNHPPFEASLVIFGGSVRPDNCRIEWVKQVWN